MSVIDLYSESTLDSLESRFEGQRSSYIQTLEHLLESMALHARYGRRIPLQDARQTYAYLLEHPPTVSATYGEEPDLAQVRRLEGYIKDISDMYPHLQAAILEDNTITVYGISDEEKDVLTDYFQEKVYNSCVAEGLELPEYRLHKREDV